MKSPIVSFSTTARMLRPFCYDTSCCGRSSPRGRCDCLPIASWLRSYTSTTSTPLFPFGLFPIGRSLQNRPMDDGLTECYPARPSGFYDSIRQMWAGGVPRGLPLGPLVCGKGIARSNIVGVIIIDRVTKPGTRVLLCRMITASSTREWRPACGRRLPLKPEVDGIRFTMRPHAGRVQASSVRGGWGATEPVDARDHKVLAFAA
jgi:hypothetical protein